MAKNFAHPTGAGGGALETRKDYVACSRNDGARNIF
jgi:hypothetical protein